MQQALPGLVYKLVTFDDPAVIGNRFSSPASRGLDRMVSSGTGNNNLNKVALFWHEWSSSGQKAIPGHFKDPFNLRVGHTDQWLICKVQLEAEQLTFFSSIFCFEHPRASDLYFLISRSSVLIKWKLTDT